MLVLPMRSQDSSPSRPKDHDAYTHNHHSLPSRHREPSPQTEDLRKQVAGAMLSVMPATRPPAPKRPKLSLQTSIPQMLPAHRRGTSLTLSATDSPTTRNTKTNAFDAPPPTPSSAIQPPQEKFPSSLAISTFSSSPSNSTTSSSSSSSNESPFSNTPPYTLPLGTHSILRNSPLPRRHISASTQRPPRRIFPPIKRVAFRDHQLTEILPTPIYEPIPSQSDEDISTNEEGKENGHEPAPTTTTSEEEHQRRREEIQAEDGHATPTHFRRKRRREWIWRPLGDDDVLMEHEPHLTREESQGHGPSSPAAIPLPDSAVEYHPQAIEEEKPQGHEAISPTTIPSPNSTVAHENNSTHNII